MLPASSSAIGQLAAALAKAQVELVNPAKTQIAVLEGGRSGSGGKCYRYAPLSAGLEIIRSTLGRHEIAVIQATEVDAQGEMVLLATTLAHSSGEWIAARWPVCRVSDMGNPQLMGAALTYARRYGLFALAGLAGEDDLDAAGVLGAETSDDHGALSSRVEPNADPASGATPPLPFSGPGGPEPAEARVPAGLGTSSDTGPHFPRRSRKGGTRPAPPPAPIPDPAADLALVEDADALFQWALQALPLRNALEEAQRMALDAAFVARAEAIGADPELLLPFRFDRVPAEGDRVGQAPG